MSAPESFLASAGFLEILKAAGLGEYVFFIVSNLCRRRWGGGKDLVNGDRTAWRGENAQILFPSTHETILE